MVTNDHSRAATVPATWVDPAPMGEPSPRWRRALPLLVWLGCLAVAVALLQVLGSGRLAAPALADPGSWQTWAAGRDPLEVVMVVLRLLALGVAWYLTGVTSVSVIARLLRAARLVRIADALSVGPVRVLVQQALGVGLAAGVLATSVPGVAAPGRPAAPDARMDVAVMALIEDEAATEEADEAPPEELPSQPDPGVVPTVGASDEVMVPVPAPGPASSAAPSIAPTSTQLVPEPEIVPPASAPPASGPPADPTPPTVPASSPTDQRPTATSPEAMREVRVEPGDHFWALAEQAVADHLGRPGSEEEVLVHWEAMLVANADRLLVPGNPDLLLPGQAVLVPDVTEVLP